MKKSLILLFILIISVLSFDNDKEWKNYKKLNKKSYKNYQEEVKRYNQFLKNEAKIKEHNSKYKKGEAFYQMSHNRFSDKDDEELASIYLHKFSHKNETDVTVQNVAASLYPPGPSSISYRSYSLPVLSQEEFGSCWAFATAAQVETQLRRKNLTFRTRISPQYLLDCAPNAGCIEGGAPMTSFSYMHEKGLIASINYPYIGEQQSCKNQAPKMTQKITAYKHQKVNGNEEQLKNLLASVGPIVVSMYVEPSTFMYYSSGIYWDKNCPNKCEKLNHAMLLIGYGTDRESAPFPIDYWLLKNSFGVDFGEAGYIRMIRNHTTFKNNCNVACYADFAAV